MEKPKIYSVSLSDIRPRNSKEALEYPSDKLTIRYYRYDQSALFLTIEAAMKRKDEIVKRYSSEAGRSLLFVCIDEFEEGADCTFGHPKRAWYYDRNGNLIKSLINEGGIMYFTNRQELPQPGDIVEIPKFSSIIVGMISAVPTPRMDFIENKNSEGDSLRDPRCYFIKTENPLCELETYEATDFIPFDKSRGDIEEIRKRINQLDVN